jgi:hypothetical protein
MTKALTFSERHFQRHLRVPFFMGHTIGFTNATKDFPIPDTMVGLTRF